MIMRQLNIHIFQGLKVILQANDMPPPHPQQRKIKTKWKPKSSQVLTSLRRKAKVLPVVHQALHHLLHHSNLSSSPLISPPSNSPLRISSPPITHSTLASLGSWLFLKQLRHNPSSGPLHGLLPLPGTLFPHYLPGSLLTAFKSLHNHHLLGEAFADRVA